RTAVSGIGPAVVAVTVNDGSNGTVSRVFTVFMTSATNTAPTISDIPAQTTLEDTSRGPIPFTIGDLQTPASSLIVTASCSNPALVLPEGFSFGGSGSNLTLTISPALNATGSAIV